MSSQDTSSGSSFEGQEEHSHEDGASKPIVLCKKKLPWRSNEANQLMASLDRRVRKCPNYKDQCLLMHPSGPLDNNC